MNSPAHLFACRLLACLAAVCACAFLLIPVALADNNKEKKSREAAVKKQPAAEEKVKPREKPEAQAAVKAKDKPRGEKPTRPAAAKQADLETRIFEVAAGFFQAGVDSVPHDPFAPQGEGHAGGHLTPKKALERIGIEFGVGASATYNPATLQLVVRNTAQQLDLIALYVAHVDAQREKQVHIIWEMIEVEHADFSDWLFDNRLDSDGTALRKWAQEKINNGDGGVIESALITARSGQRAKAESILEFIYPTEMDPPEIPNEVNLKGKAKAPITAVSPTAYETRNVGVTIEVDPVIGGDNSTIDLNLAPEKVELEGYSIWPHEDIDPLFKQRMPTFYTMRITTQITLTDGNYGFLGTTRPLKSGVEDIEDPIVLSFVRADIGIVPLAKPRQPNASKPRRGGH